MKCSFLNHSIVYFFNFQNSSRGPDLTPSEPGFWPAGHLFGTSQAFWHATMLLLLRIIFEPNMTVV